MYGSTARAVLGGGKYRAQAVTFDGSNDYLTRGADYTSNANDSQGIFSCWVNLAGGNATSLYLARGQGGYYTIQRGDTNKFAFSFTDGTGQLEFTTTSTYTSSSGWVHVLASWDTNYSAGNKVAHLYINNSSDKTSVTDTGSAFDIDYTRANHAIGGSTSGTLKLNADIADLYLAFGQFLDFSSSSNRAKFIDSDGYPMNLGADGSIPTGTAPTVFLTGTASGFATNLGTGGGMTITGALTDASTSPSD